MNRGEVIDTKIRKTRSDKKRDVKPTVSSNLRDCIYRLSYITQTPVKDVVEILCEKGLKSRKVVEYLSQYFRRDFQFINTLFIGDFKRESLQYKYQSGKNVRITTRFNQTTYENISSLAYALDVTPSKATALLLDASTRNTNILNAFVKFYLHAHVDQSRIKELKQVLKYINKNNPYNEEISWFVLLSMIFDDIKDSTSNIKEKIHSWIDKYK